MAARQLRGILDEDPELYDRARPEYPDELIEDIVALAGLRPGSRVAEIGAGTGQATLALVERGARVVAVELGPGLAGVLRHKLTDTAVDGGEPAEVVVSAFEDWPLPAEPFDSLLAFTAWHWLDPAVRTRKAAAALRPGGALATVATVHVAGGSEAFFIDVQACYERWDPPPHPTCDSPGGSPSRSTIGQRAAVRTGVSGSVLSMTKSARFHGAHAAK